MRRLLLTAVCALMVAGTGVAQEERELRLEPNQDKNAEKIKEVREQIRKLREQERALRRQLRDLERGSAPRKRDPRSREDFRFDFEDAFERFEDMEGFEGLQDNIRKHLRGLPDFEGLRRLREFKGLEDLDAFKNLKDFDAFKNLGKGLRILSQGQNIKIDQSEDGVRVEVRKLGEGGKESVKVYEAESMEELRKKHPELLENHGVFFGGRGGRSPFRLDVENLRIPRFELDGIEMPDLDLDFDVEDLRERFRVLRPENLRDLRDLGDVHDLRIPFGALRGASSGRLGVMVEDAGDGAAGALEVVDVLGGSLAEKLGVEDGDVLMSINGKKIGDGSDVRDALRAVRPGGKITLQVDRPGKGKQTLETTRPGRKRVRRSI